MAKELCQKLDVPYDNCGSLVLAYNQTIYKRFKIYIKEDNKMVLKTYMFLMKTNQRIRTAAK